MTTIAYRDGVIAADTLVTEGGCKIGFMTKIGKNKRLIAGASGDAAFVTAFLSWVEDGGDRPETPEASTAFSVDRSGLITSYDETGVTVFKAEFYAIGSGSRYALAAMSLGVSAKEAVKTAISLDVFSGGKIEVLHATS